MAEQDRINALSGGAPLPQADTMTIARRLLGPGIAERYGDVIGARPTTAGDVARDFTLGFMSGDPLKADALKMQVAQQYNDELRKADDQRMQQEQAAREQLNGFFSLLEQGRSVPKDLKKEFFKEGMTKLGVDVTSPLFMKILSDSDKFADVYDALGDPAIRQMAEDNPIGAAEQLIAMGHDGSEVLKVVSSVQQLKRYQADTSRILSGIGQKAARAPKDDTEKRRQAWIGQRLGKAKTDEFGMPVGTFTIEDLEPMADQIFGPKPGQVPLSGLAQGTPLAGSEGAAGALGIAGVEAAAPAPAAPAPAPVGIAQKTAGSPDAVAAAKKRLGL